MNCPYCQKPAKWCDNAEVYGRRYGKSYMCYWCKDCDAYVGCHNNTARPLGTMANKELRQWRMKAHAVIDPIARTAPHSRKSVYRRLEKVFGRPIHIGESDIELCKQVIVKAPAMFVETNLSTKD